MQCKIQRKSWYWNPCIWKPCGDVLIPVWTVIFFIRIWYARSRLTLTQGSRSPCDHPLVGTVSTSPQGSAGGECHHGEPSRSPPAPPSRNPWGRMRLVCRSLHCVRVLLTWGMDASFRDSASCELEVVLIFSSSRQTPLLSLLRLLKFLWKAEVDVWHWRTSPQRPVTSQGMKTKRHIYKNNALQYLLPSSWATRGGGVEREKHTLSRVSPVPPAPQYPQRLQHSSTPAPSAPKVADTRGQAGGSLGWEPPRCLQSLLHKQRTSLRGKGKQRHHIFKEINDGRQRKERTKLLRSRAYFISAPCPSPCRTHAVCGFRQTGGFNRSHAASASTAFEDVMGERGFLWSPSFKKIGCSLPLFRDELFKAFRNSTKPASLPFPRALTSRCTVTALTCLVLCFSRGRDWLWGGSRACRST